MRRLFAQVKEMEWKANRGSKLDEICLREEFLKRV
jgi:hypothetical protein